MAVTYMLAGVGAALSGTMLAGALQNAWVLGSFSLLFVILSLSMFGYFELQLPASLQTGLSKKASIGSGSLIGTVLMGAISALVVSPCVAAPLAGALLYIAKTGNVVIGGSALFCMALGMGVPLMAAGVLTGSILPRAGAWMEFVKKGFGLLLLAVAAWLLKPVAPEGLVMLAWAALLVVGGIGLYRSPDADKLRKGELRALRGTATVSMLVGCLLLGNVLAGPQGLTGLLMGRNADTQMPPLAFVPVKDLAGLENRVLNSNRTAMVFITADWCSWCQKMKHTLDDPGVKNRLQGFDMLMVDMSDTTKDDKRLMRRLGVYGPPGIVFIAAEQGKMRMLRSIIGYQKPAAFINIVKSVTRRQLADVEQNKERRL
jgi:thioredoxin:protein disulfide reductase